jgi:restriction system protein
VARQYYRPYSRRYSRKPRYHQIPTPLILVAPVALLLFIQFGQGGQAFSWWPVLVGLGVLVIGAVLFLWWQHNQQQARRRALQLADIDRMDGITFEHYVADLLRSQGYTQVSVTPSKNDFGADVLFSDPSELNPDTSQPVTYAAQVKRHRGFVGVEALYQAAGGRDYYQRQRAAVITNSRFSTQALELAAKTKMLLVDRATLTDWIVAFQKQK